MSAAHAAGLIVLAASGNDGDPHAISFPACLRNVISVGATFDTDLGPVDFGHCFHNSTDVDVIACYSNSGPILDLLAPAHCASTAQAGGGTWSCFGGTSSSTPFAAGVSAALLEAAGGHLNNDDMRRLLADHGVELLDPKNNLLKPRIDTEASLQALLPHGNLAQISFPSVGN